LQLESGLALREAQAKDKETVFMDTVESYEAPRVVDYGDLQELTAACAGSSGGDAYTAAGGVGVFGTSAPKYGCKSNP
jgi:hypothetical protein